MKRFSIGNFPSGALQPKYRSIVSMLTLVGFELLLLAFVSADWNAAGRVLDPDFAPHLQSFQVAMILVMVLTVGLLWMDQWKKSQLSRLISCISLLLSFALVNQVQFRDAKPLFLILGMAVCVVMYVFARHSLLLTCDAAVLTYAIGAVGLALANYLFGTDPNENGARLWILLPGFMFQPSEAIKVLLLMLLGAVTSNRKFRSLACVISLSMSLFYVSMKDLGNAALMGFVTVLCLFFLYDRKWIPVASMALLIGVFLVVNLVEIPEGSRFHYVWKRFQPVPVSLYTHQGRLLVAIGSSGLLFGLGTDAATLVTKIFAGSSDCALGSFLALYGLPMFLLLMLTVYRTLRVAVGRSFRHPAYFVFALGFCGYLFISYLMNFLGSVGCIPFTGIVALFISTGGTSMLCSMAMVGLLAAGLNPTPPKTTLFPQIVQWNCPWELWISRILPKKD